MKFIYDVNTYFAYKKTPLRYEEESATPAVRSESRALGNPYSVIWSIPGVHQRCADHHVPIGLGKATLHIDVQGEFDQGNG